MGIPTPNTDHLSEKQFWDVYEPAEDTFALLDALEEDAEELREKYKNALPIVVEIGSGSGCVSAFTKYGVLENVNSLYFSTDISMLACRASSITMAKNKTPSCSESFSDIINTRFIQALRLRKSVDILIFNPPYVPTETQEIPLEGTIAAAWAGGFDGMEVTSKLLDSLDDILSPTGVFYLVTVARNKPNEIIKQMECRGFKGSNVLVRRAGGETLSILKFYRLRY
ncbi:prorein methyltransferase Mtq2 [Schizosaccharomyces japonicus yFS275]|uniref:Prorein methyltransferase Mtq2 n=1 Tax=Schizosaccharomyces japonicus (strain yFS275 / FY16936) TaxID=402676 RepID=B6K5H5_SCHJY|nr:prorein methyltransferase Mtq2 [Schizosaccharomyces japonicus yFS275]EEB08779.1 prorein methyltransferase Mtq2 [Schizosaccharomyces japonicus yFS275]